MARTTNRQALDVDDDLASAPHNLHAARPGERRTCGTNRGTREAPGFSAVLGIGWLNETITLQV